MKILFIIPWLPYPLNHGGAQAFFNMVDEIRKHFQVTLLLNCWTESEEQNIHELQRIWENVDVRYYDYRNEQKDAPQPNTFEELLDSTNMNAYNKKMCHIMNKFQNSLHRKISRRIRKANAHMVKSHTANQNIPVNQQAIAKSRSTLYHHYNALTEGFIEWVYKTSREGFDLIQVEFYEYLPLIHILPKDVETVFLHHEIRFIHNENELTVFGETTPRDHLLLEDEKGREINNLSKFDNVMVLTDVDKDILQPLLPNSKIYVSPAITESAKKLDKHTEFKPSGNLVFMGNSDHMPNLDGLLWMCSDVMPLITKAHPDIVLHVTGRWDQQSQAALKALCPNIHFTGFVEDISEFINGKISIIPIRIGSGMRMKIIDTVASNAPMVTTTKGCEGLCFENGVDAMIADEPTDFANAVNLLIENVEIQRKISSSAHQKMLSSMNTEVLLNKRIQFYRGIQDKQA